LFFKNLSFALQKRKFGANKEETPPEGWRRFPLSISDFGFWISDLLTRSERRFFDAHIFAQKPVQKQTN